MTKEASATPQDFAIRYEWQEGSLPPPGHYEYTIRVGPVSEGEIVFYPDYPQHDPPVWTERFVVDGAAWDRLYRLMVDKGVFGKAWKEMDRPPVGGSLYWLYATAHGERVTVSQTMVGTETLEEVVDAVRALVPQEIWTKLRSQHDQYEQEYFERRR